VRDLYEVLQIHPSADPDVVRAAYHKLASKLHPDKNPGADPARMAELNMAWAVLQDPQQRSNYDTMRASQAAPHSKRKVRKVPKVAEPTAVVVKNNDSDIGRLILLGLGILIGIDCS
jgi:DnaJ-class molecular chaperone